MAVSKRPVQTAPARVFQTKAGWSAWLEKNHAKSPGLWLRIAKKDTKARSITYQEALEAALCYGWIDAQKRPESQEFWLQRFVPRAAKSLWSRINREKALALMGTGEMKPAGLLAVENAKQDGRWDAAYDSPSASTVPADFQSALDASPPAKEFFHSLNKANRYAVLWRIQTAKKAETRARKIVQFIAMLERKEKIHE